MMMMMMIKADVPVGIPPQYYLSEKQTGL